MNPRNLVIVGLLLAGLVSLLFIVLPAGPGDFPVEEEFSSYSSNSKERRSPNEGSARNGSRNGSSRSLLRLSNASTAGGFFARERGRRR